MSKAAPVSDRDATPVAWVNQTYLDEVQEFGESSAYLSRERNADCPVPLYLRAERKASPLTSEQDEKSNRPGQGEPKA